MKIGYPCSNLTLDCRASRTFRLASYSPERLIETVRNNLACIATILEWNAAHGILFFRLSSDTVPFASHEVMTVDWQSIFADDLRAIGDTVRRHDMRINVHPGQYILLNAEKPEIVERSIAELIYHAELLDGMGLDHTHKIQIHTGGIYGDKPAATRRFIERYPTLPENVRRRLVIENDERQFALADNLVIHEATGIPLLFDTFHHSIFNHGGSLEEAFDRFIPTWNGHGLPMMDYSSQHPEKQTGAHTPSIDMADFGAVMDQLGQRDVDLMLEIKDKEGSALRALAWVQAREVARAAAAATP